jgi:hypothetical protein
MTDERRLTIFSLANSLLCAVMAVCLAAVALRLIELIGASGLGNLFAARNGLLAGFVLVSLEVQWTRRLMAPRDLISLDWLKGIVLEWSLLLLGLCAFIWLAEGPDFARKDLRALSELNFTGLIRAEHMVGLILLVLVWGFNRVMVEHQMPLENFWLPVSNEGLQDLDRFRTIARNRLWQNVFLFGGLMVLVSLAGASILRAVRNSTAQIGPLGTEVLVYFLCGLGIFTVSRLMTLRLDWILDRTRQDAGIPRRWMIYSLGFIVLVIVFAAALPTDYSLNLITSLGLALQGIGGVVMLLWSLIVFPILLLVSYVFSLLPAGPKPAPNGEEQKPLADLFPALPGGITWIGILREIFLCVIVILAAVYFLRQLLKFRLLILRRVRGWPVLGWILDRLRGFEQRLSHWRTALARVVRNSLSGLREDFTRRTGWEPFGHINLRSLTPRQSIRFYFFALLRRGAERGVVRRPSQTPREYAANLVAREAEIGDAVREMAFAFEESRYTSHDIAPDKARRVRIIWNAIRSKIRGFGSYSGTGGKTQR